MPAKRRNGVTGGGFKKRTTTSAAVSTSSAGLKAKPKGFVIRGQVRYPDDRAVAGLTVGAFDSGLRSEVRLGSAKTDADGKYEIRYRREQLRPAGKLAADLIVRAYDQAGQEIARSDLQCHVPTEAVLDLVVGNVPLRGPSEYDQLLKAVTPYLGETGLADLERDDVDFLSCSARVDRVQVATLIVANRLTRETSLPDWLFYALGRQGVRLQLAAMVLVRREALRHALSAAIEANIVSPPSGEDVLDSLLEQLQAVLVRAAFDEQRNRGRFSMGALLGTSLVGRDLQEAFLARYLARPESPGELWKSLEDDQRFSSDAINDLLLTLLLGRLTRYRLPVLEQLKRLRQSGEVTSLRDLARLDRSRWREMLRAAAGAGGLDLPEDIPGETPEDRLQHYITSLRAPIESLFPSDSLRRALKAAPDTDPKLTRFLSNAEDLDLYWTNIEAYLGEHRETALAGIPASDHAAVIARVKGIQRLLRVSPRADHVRVLDAAGFDSALAVARTPKRRFRKRFVEVAAELKDALDDAYVVRVTSADEAGVESRTATLMMMNSAAPPDEVADAIHDMAVSASGHHLQTYVSLHTNLQLWPGAVGGPEDLQKKAKEDAYKEIPDLEALFGSQSFCECEHCRSVYSPAAYLVDLLHSLDDLTKKNKDGTLKLVYEQPVEAPTPIGELLGRRSDIAHIPLTCENTNTPLPYVDLVNEALESFIGSHLNAGEWTDVVSTKMPIQPHDTGTATAEELRAVPQYVVPEVYAHLGRKAVYPMTLPFHRPLEVARAYLGHLGASRAEIMEVFRTAGAPSELALVVERLGMCPVQYQIIAATTSTDPIFDGTDGLKGLWAYYGYGSAAELSSLIEVPKLLHRTGMAFDELVAVLKTRFLNPKLYSEAGATPATKVVKIEFPSSPGDDACDVSKMTLANLDPVHDPAFAHGWLDRLHRFVRLWRALSWTAADVDRALTAVGGAIDDTSLEKVAALAVLAGTLDRPVASLLALWGDLDTWGVEITKDPAGGADRVTPREESRYAQVFLNPAVLQDDTRKVFEDVLRREAGLLSSPPEKLDEHVPSVAAALAITGDDVERIRNHAGLVGTSVPLDLATLSTLYRYATLARVLGIRGRDLITLLRLVPASMDPFASNDPRPALEFVRTVRSVEASGFPIPLLNYLFRDEAEPTRHPAPTRALVKTTLETLQAGLQAIHQELAVTEQPPADVLRAKLEIAGPRLTLEAPDGVERALAVLDPRTTAFQGQNLTLQDRKTFVNDHFKSFLTDPATALFGTALPEPTNLEEGEKRFLENVQKVLDALLPWLRGELQETLVVNTMADAMGVEQTIMQRLLEKGLASTDTQQPGTALEYFLSLVDADGTATELHLEDDPPQPPTLMVHRVFKAAAYVNGAGMTDDELELFTGASSPLLTFDPNTVLELNLNALPIEGVVPASSPLPGQLFKVWGALRAYHELRDALPRSEKTLVDYFKATDAGTKLATLVEATGWHAEQIKDVVQAYGLPNPPDTLPGLIRLQRAMALLKRVGATPDRMFAWAGTTPDHPQAEEIVQTVKARYERARWLEVARGLNDPLREKQRDALVAFLIPRLKGAPFPIEAPNDLFEYFLIDVEMSSCMLTSRIKQAISSVQLFVQRCLLNLEPAVSPEQIDADRWQVMKHYRIWEANLKVFLFPETYILPELRDDKTPFFKELETELLQNELTDEAIEKAFANYLYKLDEVARLDIRGFCREVIPETPKSGETQQEVYHVFGRTWNPPYIYYYRRGTFTKGSGNGEWTPWERVDLDIAVDPKTYVDHLIPMVIDRRVHLFWLVLEEKPKPGPAPIKPEGDTETEGDAGASSAAEPQTVFSIRLAYSEYRDGRWSRKQVSSGTVLSVDPLHALVGGSEFTWGGDSVTARASDSSDGQIVGIYTEGRRQLFIGDFDRRLDALGSFALSPCPNGSPLTVDGGVPDEKADGIYLVRLDGMRWKSRPGTGKLMFSIGSQTANVLATIGSLEWPFSILPEPRREALQWTLWRPFFYQGRPSCYFARPVLETAQPLVAEIDGTSSGFALTEFASPPHGLIEKEWGPDPVTTLAIAVKLADG